MRTGRWILILGFLAAAAIGPPAALALESGVGAEAEAAGDAGAFALDNFFVFICALLVLFMQPGFAMVEAGFNAAKNTVNILFKNTMDLCVGALLFFAIGFSLMYGAPAVGGLLGFSGFGIAATLEEAAGAGVLHPQVNWLFQAAFAATAATIVSGAVAGRMKFKAYLVYSAVLTGLVYPISGFWTWGGGWLDELGFHDFAGSVIVHAVGGFAGLAGAIALGPRLGRFGADGRPRAMPGHNLAIATLGVFILWVGWFGFNPGSQLAVSGAGDVATVMTVAVNTLLAAAAGGVLAMLATWTLHRKPDLTVTLNGVLAGLVAITANCDVVGNGAAVAIGGIGGVLVVLGIKLLDRLGIDDPVGAWPVHGLCGVWGGLAAAIFGGAPLPVQVLGSLVIPLWSFVTLFGLFRLLRSAGLLRVDAEEEIRGLDIGEHGEEAYNGFQIFTAQ